MPVGLHGDPLDRICEVDSRKQLSPLILDWELEYGRRQLPSNDLPK